MERVDFPAAWAAINGGVNMIKLKHIYKSYSLGDEQVDVLHDINLHVKPKEFVSILGPSGSGKSTLMNIIGCLDIPDSGDYILDGEYVDNCTENDFRAGSSKGLPLPVCLLRNRLLFWQTSQPETLTPLPALRSWGLLKACTKRAIPLF